MEWQREKGHALTKAFKYATSPVHILTSLRTHFGDIVRGTIQFSGAFVKLRKVMFVYLFVRPSGWNNSVFTEQIFKKFDTWVFFENLSRKCQASFPKIVPFMR
jgi:hypothetical protein